MLTEPDITQLFVAWANGDTAAFDRLEPAVHQELHRLASGYMAGERRGHVLQTTALLNEAYMRLVGWKDVHVFRLPISAKNRFGDPDATSVRIDSRLFTISSSPFRSRFRIERL
jgi:hypothetical protein